MLWCIDRYSIGGNRIQVWIVLTAILGGVDLIFWISGFRIFSCWDKSIRDCSDSDISLGVC